MTHHLPSESPDAKKSPLAAGPRIDFTSLHTSDGECTLLLDGRSREEGELLPPPPLAPDSPFELPHGNVLFLRRATPRELTWLNRRAIAIYLRRCREGAASSSALASRGSDEPVGQEHFPRMRPAEGLIKKPKYTANTAELSPPGRATVQVAPSPTTVRIFTSQSQRPNKGHVNTPITAR